MSDMVDWNLAVATAARLAGGGPSVTFAEAAAVVTDLRRMTDESEIHVQDFTHLTAQVDHPPVRVVDRADWADVNVAGFRTVLTPLTEKLVSRQGAMPGAITIAVGSRVAGLQVGGILAFLASKVLGQYEVFSGAPGQLLLVAPNIVAAERSLDVDPHDFRLWVCLHEVTHRTQFTAVPWLRDHFLSEVSAFMDAADPDAMKDRLFSAVGQVARAIRDLDTDVSIIDLVQTPAQKLILDRLTALMTLVEGHAEHVMNGVGPMVVPSVEAIHAKFQARRAGTGPFDRALRRLLGIDVKMKQYADGSRFVAAVVEQVGMDGFNRVWTSPETLPTVAEISDAPAWIERVHGIHAS
ncbi:MAG: zinc-dependent metalloprotease [Actinomycetota bacterium]|nr:zinc-dependent metalloprotease [Actinomycetota bacterium]